MTDSIRPARSGERAGREQTRPAAQEAVTEGAHDETVQFADHRAANAVQLKVQDLIAASAPVQRLERWATAIDGSRGLAADRPAQLKHTKDTYEGNYDGNEIRQMLNDSQGRNGSTGAAGHVREHVADAKGTQDYAQAEQKKKTCFVNDAQQNDAVVSALNSGTGQSELKKFDGPGAPNRIIISNVGIDQVNAWQSDWDPATQKAGKAKKIHATKATVIVDIIPGLNRPEIHVQTAYPLDG